MQTHPTLQETHMIRHLYHAIAQLGCGIAGIA
jgi:hypothetical protein